MRVQPAELVHGRTARLPARVTVMINRVSGGRVIIHVEWNQNAVIPCLGNSRTHFLPPSYEYAANIVDNGPDVCDITSTGCRTIASGS